MVSRLAIAMLAVAASSCADRDLRREDVVRAVRASREPVAAPATTVAVTIGDAGGVVELPGGPRLVIPPHSLASAREISITRLGDRYPVGGITPAFTFAPHDIVFAVPATVSFPAHGARSVDITWRTGAASTQLGATLAGDTLSGAVTRLGTAHLAQRTRAGA